MKDNQKTQKLINEWFVPKARAREELQLATKTKNCGEHPSSTKRKLFFWCPILEQGQTAHKTATEKQTG